MKKNKYLNISILSYNVNWKIMKSESSPLLKSFGVKKLNELKSNILKNILLVKNYYNPYFYCLRSRKSI